MNRLLGTALTLVALSLLPSGAGAQDLSRYRDFTFGSSVDAVIAVTRSAPSEIVVQHTRPRLVQELVWTPRYTVGGAFRSDSAREVRFRFLDDQLFSIVVLYDAYQIEGLTARDVIAAVSALYGEPVKGTAPVAATAADTASLAEWRSGDFAFSLSESAFPSPFRLAGVVVSVSQEAARAVVEARRLDVLEAPQREAAERERRRELDVNATDSNKAGFRP